MTFGCYKNIYSTGVLEFGFLEGEVGLCVWLRVFFNLKTVTSDKNTSSNSSVGDFFTSGNISIAMHTAVFLK